MRRILPAVLLLMAMLACIWLSASALGRPQGPSPAGEASNTPDPATSALSSPAESAAPAASLPEVAGPPATQEDRQPVEGDQPEPTSQPPTATPENSDGYSGNAHSHAGDPDGHTRDTYRNA